MLALAPDTKVIVLTGQNDRANALRAIGARRLRLLREAVRARAPGLTIERAFRLHELQQENRRLQRALRQPDASPASSRATRRCCGSAARSRRSRRPAATVLLLGERGTGKELLARALHDRSPRRKERFVAINCAAIPENLLESELFGYEKGAFTGAVQADARARSRPPNGGTLFLDEIGDLPLALQAKLLRFLQERVIERVGGREEIPVDVRIVCATHQNLQGPDRRKAASARTSTTGWPRSSSRSRRCASARATPRCSRTRSCSASPPSRSAAP